MESLKHTAGPWKVSPVNSNLIYSEQTQDCIAIIYSGKFNGLSFPEDRQEKQDNARLVSRAPEMYEFLKRLLEIIPKNNATVFGNTFNERYDNEFTIGEKIENLITKK